MLAIAITAIDGFIIARLKRNFGCLAAIGTGRWEHLAGGATADASVAFCLTSRPASGAALGFIDEPFSLEELLFLRCEDKTDTAIAAGQRFRFKSHLVDLLSLILVRVWVIHARRIEDAFCQAIIDNLDSTMFNIRWTKKINKLSLVFRSLSNAFLIPISG